MGGSSFQQVVLDIVEAGYEVTFRPGDPNSKIDPILRVDLVYRGETSVHKASGAISKSVILLARDETMKHFLLRLLENMQVVW